MHLRTNILGIALLLPCLCQASLQSDLEALVDQAQADNGVPGMLVGVWRGESEVAIFEKGVSGFPSTPISALDHTRVGSVTKSFTVTRLLQLAQDGALSLDDEIGSYVPGVQNGTATLRQLANMTSGIFNYTEDSVFVNELFSDLSAPWTDQQLVDVANNNSAYFAPGGGWHYSNTNTVLLGMVIEQVTGNTLKEEIESGILSPLGLSETSYPDTTAMPEPHLSGYMLDVEEGYIDVTTSNPSSSAGSGAMISSLEDLRSWAKTLATGEGILDEEMQEIRLDLVSTVGGEGPYYDAYGLGIGSIEGWIGHTGAYIGYQSLVMYDPLNDQTVVILTNLMAGDHIPTDLFLEMAPLLAIPEPSTWGLLLLALGLGVFACRFRKSNSQPAS